MPDTDLPDPAADPAAAVWLRGRLVDGQSRCEHYATERDVVALRLDCCPGYWACRQCHDELVGHPARVVPAADFASPHAVCGVCRTLMDVPTYRAASRCAACGAEFNPACALHDHLYFAQGHFAQDGDGGDGGAP